MEKPSSIPEYALPSQFAIATARPQIHHHLPPTPLGTSLTTDHIHALTAGFPNSSTSPRYYGFVTGGSTPAATAAEHIAVHVDQNVQVHLPDESIGTDIEYHALEMLAELFDLSDAGFKHKILTTGATGSNVLGLAIGREVVLANAAESKTGKRWSVAQSGIARVTREAGVEEVQVLTSAPHSSLRKACAVVGLGHDCIVDIGSDMAGQGQKVDLGKLEAALKKKSGIASIIAISCAEVNTGLFATDGEDMKKIRQLADAHSAWIHVDAAFGLMARCLPVGEEFARVRRGVAGLQLADSIAGDAHKLLNVPYDSGFFFSKSSEHAQQVFQNPGAVYLSAASSAIPSPLNLGLENSRRFRALPLYANLIAYGKDGCSDMIVRQTVFARRIAKYLDEAKGYELLPEAQYVAPYNDIYIIVLFRAKDEAINEQLIKRINNQRLIYCSGTKWADRPAVRFAVANWQVDEARDWPVVQKVLDEALV